MHFFMRRRCEAGSETGYETTTRGTIRNMAKSNPLTKMTFVLLSMMFILACGGGGGGASSSSPPAPPPAPQFPLAGSLYVIGVSRGGANDGIFDGGFNVATITNSSGDITTGTYTHNETTVIAVTGGSISLDAAGFLSGFASSNDGDKDTIQYGKLNASRQSACYVSSTTFGEYRFGALFKSGNTFSSSDVQGVWRIYEMTSGSVADNVYYETMTVGANGSFTMSNGTAGTIAIDAYGIMSGNGTLVPSGTIVLQGVMDATKEFGAFHTVYSNGDYSASIAVKQTGTFSLADLSDTWYFTLAGTGGSEEVSYGELQLDASGTVKGGYYRSAGGNVPLTGGSVSIDPAGVLSGNIIASSSNMTFTISDGKLNASKNMMTIAGQSNVWGIVLMMANK